MDFNTPSMPAGKIDGAQRDQLMEQVKQQIAVANAQELLQVYTHNFINTKWISKPIAIGNMWIMKSGFKFSNVKIGIHHDGQKHWV